MKGTGFSPYMDADKKSGALAPEGSSSATTHWTSTGWDTIEFRIATNPGEPMNSLVEIASGGELSRVMLALKVAVEETSSKSKKTNPTPRTLVFDEIDIGIGGRAAEAVGQKLKALSRNQQVLCVTHLPQIAAFADQHLVVEKKESDGRTKTQIRTLDDRARNHEVARMLSGARVTDTSLQHAVGFVDGFDFGERRLRRALRVRSRQPYPAAPGSRRLPLPDSVLWPSLHARCAVIWKRWNCR